MLTRDQTIIDWLHCGPLTTSQLAQLAGFPSLRRAQGRLQKLAEKKLIRRTPLPSSGPGRGENLCYVGRKPRPSAIAHAIGLGDALVGLHAGATRHELCLRVFTHVQLGGLIPDAVCILSRAQDEKHSLLFVEYDNATQRLSVWTSKAQRYTHALDEKLYTSLPELTDLSLRGFRVLVVARSARRVRAIQQAVYQVETRPIFWMTTRAQILADGLGDIWCVAGSDQPQPLVRQIQR